MLAWALLLILAQPTGEPNQPVDATLEARYPDAEPIYQYGFENNVDELDEWPTGWSRKTGPGYPRYLPAKVRFLPTFEGKRVLRLQLDGAAIVCQSPIQRADPDHGYVVEAMVKTERLQHDRAIVSLEFLDAQARVLQTASSPAIISPSRWQKVRLGPVACRDPSVKSLQIALRLEPMSANQADLVGAAQFDDLYIGRLPHVALDCPQPCHLFDLGQPVTIHVRRIVESTAAPEVRLRLVDRRGDVARAETGAVETLPGDAAELDWRIKPEVPGYYSAFAEWRGASGFSHISSLPIVVMEQRAADTQAEFGWSLEMADLETPNLVALLKAAGAGRVKLPLWFDANDRDLAEQRTLLCEQLRRAGIGVVGVLDKPPAEVAKQLPARGQPSAARTLESSPDLWLPSVEPVVSRLAWHVRDWQWGADGDLSCVGYAPLAERLLPLKTQLSSVGQDLTLAVPWDWSAGPVATKDRTGKITPFPWRQLSRGPEPALSADELRRWLDGLGTATGGPWITLPATLAHTGRHPTADAAANTYDDAAAELVHYLLTAKVHGAAAVFVHRPLAAGSGLATPDGAPQPLLLPWRTTARLIGSSEYLGRVQLPAGSENHVFARRGQATMVAWSPTRAVETLYLGGNDLRQVDPWGRSTRPRRDGHLQAIELLPTPTFITGINESVVRWMMRTKLGHTQLSAQFGINHSNSLTVTNTFPQAVTGRVKIVPPRGWRMSNDEFELQLQPGASQTIPFEWFVPFNAVTGAQNWQADFEIEAGDAVKFSAYGDLSFGTDDVSLQLTSHLNERGDLIIEQHLTNKTPRTIQMRCDLMAPAQRRQRLIVRVPASGEVRTLFRYLDGRSLLGQTLWLRCEEINGQHIISRRFQATASLNIP